MAVKKTPAKEVKAPRYRVLVGLNYKDKRFEPGAVIYGLPEESLEWLLEQNAIEKVED